MTISSNLYHKSPPSSVHTVINNSSDNNNNLQSSTTAYTAAVSAAAIATSDNEQINNRQKRNKFLSFFPSSSKDENTSSCSSNIMTSNSIQHNSSNKWISSSYSSNNKAQAIHCPTSTSFYSSPTTTSSSTITTSSSSSSTVCPSPIPTMSKPHFIAINPSCIPDYAKLRKHFSKFQSKSKHKADILKVQLLPWLRKYVIHLRLQQQSEYKDDAYEESGGLWGLKNASKEKKELHFGRSILLRWWRALLSSMLLIDHEDRCLYYESILEIITRCEFVDFDYVGPFDYSQWSKNNNNPHLSLLDEYRQLLNTTLKYALDKLNQRAIYSNMISFCAKILALCYFKIPGLASSLLQVLNIRPTIMKRLCTEMTDSSSHYLPYKDNLKLIFPPYLHQLMASNTQSYKNYFTAIKTQKTKLPINLSGNWIRRWQSDDSELFFSFYRHYHSTLKSYISAIYPTINRHQLHQRNAIIMSSPGYMYFASFFAGKIDSLIHREIHSVTTVDQQQPVNNAKKISFLSSTIAPVGNISMIDETGPFTSAAMGGYSDYTTAKAHHSTPTGKPKPLEMATRRYAECMVWCIVAADPDGLYHDMINVWIRFSIKKTVLTEAEGVYCLLDFIEQAILELQKFPLKRNYFPIDIPFILHTLDIILSQSDHTISLLRALSFIYVHFGFLTSHAALLDLLCNRIMLDTQTFERLLLHWGKNVRIFFLRCLMWRVGRVSHPSGIRWNSEAEQMVKMMVRGNKDAAMCDGHSCWSAWVDKSKENVSPDTTAEIKAYRQCSLEVHIVLESLMASFHRNYSQLQHLLVDLQAREKLDLVTSTNSSVCTSPIPERIRCFSSQLAIPAVVSNHTLSSISTILLNGENNESDTLNRACNTSSHKRSRPSPTFKKRHMITRSRTGKGRLLRLFNNNSSLLPGDSTSCDGPTDDDICLTCRKDNEVGGSDTVGEETLHANEFYTVPSLYTVSSLSLALNDSTVCNERLPCISTLKNSTGAENLGTDSAQSSCQMDSSTLLDQHFENSNLLSIDLDLTNGKDVVAYPNGSELEELCTTIPQYQTPPVMLISARSWQYHPSSHVYASKILSEMKVIMHEYCIWLERTQEARLNSSMIFVPRLSLDWPKNWTFSHS